MDRNKGRGLTMKKMFEGVEKYIPDASPEEKEAMVYRAIYDWWAFGANVDEEIREARRENWKN